MEFSRISSTDYEQELECFRALREHLDKAGKCFLAWKHTADNATTGPDWLRLQIDQLNSKYERQLDEELLHLILELQKLCDEVKNMKERKRMQNNGTSNGKLQLLLSVSFFKTDSLL